MTVLKKPAYTMEDILKGENPLIMVLEDLQDPGNAGTILRTGEGAGVSGVLLTKTCVDITNPKVIRSTMGSIYRMPFLYVENVLSLKQQLAEKNVRTFAAHLKGKILTTGNPTQGELPSSSEMRARVLPGKLPKQQTVS